MQDNLHAPWYNRKRCKSGPKRNIAAQTAAGNFTTWAQALNQQNTTRNKFTQLNSGAIDTQLQCKKNVVCMFSAVAFCISDNLKAASGQISIWWKKKNWAKKKFSVQ